VAQEVAARDARDARRSASAWIIRQGMVED